MSANPLPKTLAAVAALLVLAPSAPAHAGDGPGVLMSYGYIAQTRKGDDSTGHLLAIGIHSPGEAIDYEEMFFEASLEFVVDREYDDLTQIAFTGEFAYAMGSRYFGFWSGMAIRTGIDGYPKASWSPMDLGVVLGLGAFLEVVGIGAEGRGWLGWNVYEDLDITIEPYWDFRVWVSFLLG